ncbi:MAG: hypothetical protein JO090_02990 [Rhizobacter sp.]|nr:hypothetical protein [Rhizobacter sp.]
MTSADRASGGNTGTKAGAAVTITIEQQSGGNLRLGFSAPTHASRTRP